MLQQRPHRPLLFPPLATASSLKKKQQQLRADQDLLADRWTEVLAAVDPAVSLSAYNPRPMEAVPSPRLPRRAESTRAVDDGEA